jgi:hypothetical protein
VDREDRRLVGHRSSHSASGVVRQPRNLSGGHAAGVEKRGA